MNRAMRTAASGMQGQQLLVDTIANNIANANTTGFKKSRLAFRSLLYQTMREPGAPTAGTQMSPSGLQVGSGTEVASSQRSFVQGEIESTGGMLDVAIVGEGFFEIAMPSGEIRYTRDGSFQMDGSGQLVTADGFRVEPGINIDQDAVNVTISQDGRVLVQDAAGTISDAGQLRLARFPNPAGLKAMGANLYMATESSGAATQLTPGDAGAGILRHQYRERSNVTVVEELIELIQAQRNYEINSRTIRVSDEMMQQLGNLIR